MSLLVGLENIDANGKTNCQSKGASVQLFHTDNAAVTETIEKVKGTEG